MSNEPVWRCSGCASTSGRYGCPQHGPQAATTRESFEQEQWRVWREEVLFQLRRIHGELETARLRGWK